MDDHHKILYISGNYTDLKNLKPTTSHQFLSCFTTIKSSSGDNNSVVFNDWARGKFLCGSQLIPLNYGSLKKKYIDYNSFCREFIDKKHSSNESFKPPNSSSSLTTIEQRSYQLMKLFWGSSAKIATYTQGDYTGSAFLSTMIAIMMISILDEKGEATAASYRPIRFMYLSDDQYAHSFTLDYFEKDPSFWVVGITKHSKRKTTPPYFHYFFSPALHNYSSFCGMKQLLTENGHSLNLRYQTQEEYEKTIKSAINSEECVWHYNNQIKNTIKIQPSKPRSTNNLIEKSEKSYGNHDTNYNQQTKNITLSPKIIIAKNEFFQHDNDQIKKTIENRTHNSTSHPQQWHSVIAYFSLLFLLTTHTILFLIYQLKKIDYGCKKLFSHFMSCWLPIITLSTIIAIVLIAFAICNHLNLNKLDSRDKEKAKKVLFNPPNSLIFATVITFVCMIAYAIFGFTSLPIQDAMGILSTGTIFMLTTLVTLYDYQCHQVLDKCYFSDATNIVYVHTEPNNVDNKSTSC